MIQVTVHQAKTHLSRLIRQALAGEEIIIARGNTPVVRIEALPAARARRRIGGGKGVVVAVAPDFDEPLEDFEEYTR